MNAVVVSYEFARALAEQGYPVKTYIDTQGYSRWCVPAWADDVHQRLASWLDARLVRSVVRAGVAGRDGEVAELLAAVETVARVGGDESAAEDLVRAWLADAEPPVCSGDTGGAPLSWLDRLWDRWPDRYGDLLMVSVVNVARCSRGREDEVVDAVLSAMALGGYASVRRLVEVLEEDAGEHEQG